jgi:hypothetical protein
MKIVKKKGKKFLCLPCEHYFSSCYIFDKVMKTWKRRVQPMESSGFEGTELVGGQNG